MSRVREYSDFYLSLSVKLTRINMNEGNFPL